MFKINPKILLLICCLVLSSGCSKYTQHTASTDRARLSASAPGNNYYYFTASQLQKSKGNIDISIALMKKAIEQDQESNYLKMELALLYLQKGDYQQALPVVEQIVEKDPDHVEALVMVGSIYQYQKKFTEAQKVYERVIDLDPKRERIFMLLGSMYMEEKRWDEAQKVYERLIRRYPKSYFGYYFLGKAELERGNHKAAESNFKQSIQLEPKLLVPRFELLALYKKNIFQKIKKEDFTIETIGRGGSLNKIVRKHYGILSKTAEKNILLINPGIDNPRKIKAGIKLRLPAKKLVTQNSDALVVMNDVIGMYKEILELSPEDSRATIELGLFYAKLGISEKSDPLFEMVGRASLTDRSIADTIIFLFFETKEFKDGIIVLEGMLKGAPDSSDLHYLAGSALDGINQKNRAIEHFIKVAPESRFHENATIQIAYLYQSQKKTDQAIQHMEQVIRQVPDNPEFLLYLGAFYEETEAYEKSEAILKQALEINADHARVRFRLGVVYDKWGKKEASIEQMKKVIAINPLDAHALNYLGYTYLDLDQNLEEAEKLIRKAIELEPEDGYITDSLGWLYYKKGDYGKALELLKKAIKLVKDDPIILEHLGDTNLQLGNRELALEYYKKARDQKESNTDDLDDKIKRLSQPDASSAP
jgi:tetratricopeptide (TPR) repeat protein